MARKDTIAKKLDQLAEKLLDGALDHDADQDACRDVFKAVSAYFIGITRAKAKHPDDEPNNVTNFTAARERIRIATEGETK